VPDTTTTAARRHALPRRRRPTRARRPGYNGAGTGAHIPVRQPPSGQHLDTDTPPAAGLGAVQLSGGGVGAGNVHAGWRMAVARRAAEAYQGNRNLAAVAVAGSVGAGLADRFSDLELDGYWIGPPTDMDRVAPVHALGGELTHWGEYDQDEKEWSEEYRVGELGVTVSNFLVGSIERFLDDVVLRASTDPVRHMRLAALQRSRPLLGAELMPAWRARADAFPDRLVSALVEQALAPEVLRGWAAREALVSRGDDLAVSDLLTWSGGLGESHPQAPTERSVSLSVHSALLIAIRPARASRPSERTAGVPFRSPRTTTV